MYLCCALTQKSGAERLRENNEKAWREFTSEELQTSMILFISVNKDLEMCAMICV